jgi:N12 class adenine-specific DNA methylase
MPLDFTDLIPDRTDDDDEEARQRQKAYARNKAWMKPGSRNFFTDLSPQEETQFQTWVKANKVPLDDSPQADYDMRGFWKALQAKDPRATSAVDPNDQRLHYPDFWKTPYHETFSAESRWADPTKAPKWNDKDQLVAPDGKVLFDDRARNQPAQPVGAAPDLSPPPDDLTVDKPKGPIDFYDLIPESGTTRVIKAGLKGYREGFEAADEPFTPETQAKLDAAQREGGIKGALANVASLAGRDVLAPLAAGAGLYRGAQSAAIEAGVPRDVASMSDAFLGMPGALRTPEAPPSAAPRGPRVEPTFGPEGGPGPTPPGPQPRWGVQAPQVGYERGLEGEVIPPEAPGQPPATRPPGQTIEGQAVPAQRIEGPAALPPEPLQPDPTPQAPLAISGPRGTPWTPTPADPWVPVAEAPIEQPQAEIPIATTPIPGQPRAEPLPAEEAPLAPSAPSAGGGVAEAGPAIQRPSVTPETAHGGPWKQVGKNIQGEPVYENPNGVRALMEDGVPVTERVDETEKGLVPRDVVGRKGQFLTTEEAGKAAAPRQNKTRDKPRDTAAPEAPKEPTKTTEKPDIQRDIEPVKEWTLLGKNEEGQDVYTNPQGVHSIVEGGIRTVEPVRMRPTRSGMVTHVPAPEDKAPEFKVATPEAINELERPETELPASASEAKLPAPTEHPGLRIKSLETGKETVIQPIGTVPPKPQAETPATEATQPDSTSIPKISYRGSGRANIGSAYGGVAEPIAGPGRYSAFSRQDAEKFGPNIEEIPVDLKNPLIIRSDGEWRALTKEAGWEFPNPFGLPPAEMKAAAAKLKEVVQSKGHDGIIVWWDNSSPLDVDREGRGIKTLRNSLGVPQVVDYRGPAETSKSEPPLTKSWAPEVKVEGKWSRNQTRFATKEEAEAAAENLFQRWTMADGARATEADEPPNYRWEDGKSVRLEEEPTLPEVAQTAGDTVPPDPPPPQNIDPVIQEATDLAQGKGPELIFDEDIDPEELEEQKRDQRRNEAMIEEVALAHARAMTEDKELGSQLDEIHNMLANGWSPGDIAIQPGIDRTPYEIRALLHHWREEGQLPWEIPSSGIQGTLPLRDAGPGAGDAEEPSEVGSDRPASSGEDGGGIRPPGPDTRPTTQRRPRTGQRGGSSGGGRNRPRDTDRVPDTGEGPETGAAGRPPPEEPVADIKGRNFTIEAGDLGEERGRIAKARDNVAAIELAKQLKAEGRAATLEEQRVLVKYVGWGGLKNAFRDSAGNFGKGMETIGARLQEILTPEEYRTAERSTQYAHYTAEHVVRSMWNAAEQMGFKGGSVFEPGMGIGHFLGMMPPDLAAKSKYRGIEMDHLTADIAKLLYPRSGISQADYTRMPLPENAFDLVIGNPPFSDAVVSSDPKYASRRLMLHDYFFAKSLDAVRPGGLLAFITSAGTMNKMETKPREYLAERAEFLGGIRLPSSAFKQSSGTEVTTDILFFKRRPEGRITIPEGEMPSWTQTGPRSLPNAEGTTTEGNVSQYFNENPEMVLGREGFFDKLYKDRYAVHQQPGTNLETDLRAAMEKLPKDVMEPELSPEQKAELDFASGQTKDGSYYLKDGKLMQYRGGAGHEVMSRGKGITGGVTKADRDRIVKLIPVRDALREVFRADLRDDKKAGTEARKALNKAYDDFVKWFGPINKANFQFRRPSIAQQEYARQEAKEEARFIGDPFYEGDFDFGPLPKKGGLGDVARARQAAREAAKATGKPFDEGSFNPEDMPDIVIEERPNIDPFLADPESYRLRSIEDYNEKTGEARKKEIFERNILQREVEPEIRSAHDGVLWSLNKLGRFDVEAIAEKMGKEPREIVSELGDAVFKLPGTEDTYQTRDEYLSGDVMTKLAIARDETERDPELRRNVEALEGAQPMPLPPSRIGMVLGMPWIGTEVVQDFAHEFLDLGPVNISYSPATGTWFVESPKSSRGWRGGGEPAGFHKWSTNQRDAYELLSDALNKTPPRIYTRPAPRENPVFDPVATRVAQDKMIEMRDAFFNPETRQGWVLNDTARANSLADIYNTTLNREVLRQWDGSWLKTPGVSSTWQWRPHQTRVVARIILDGNTYMAHAVGAGKTSAMIGAGMEMKRLGLVKKPMYVVPKHMLGQFAKEFYEQYPTARIMVADEARFHTHNRRQFVANVAQDDLDAVIITHPGFKKIPISDGFQQYLIQEQVDMLMKSLSALDEKQDRIAVGKLQNQIEKLEQRLSKSESSDKDLTTTFEEMGVDFLFVDEAHQFRKLDFATKQSQMKGIDPEGSQAGWDLFTKVRYLDSIKPGRSAVFASGTPVTNTMGELYTLSRYMQPQALRDRGLEHFDAWVQTFCAPKVTLEETAAGTYQGVTRLGQFVNMPELYKMVGGVMDIVTSNQLEQYVTRPKLRGGERQFHMAPRTPLLDEYQASLGARMRAIEARRGPPKQGDDILLSVINDGRHAAIDPRFFTETQNDPNSKLNIMLANVARIYHETGDVQFYDPASGYTKPSFRGPATQMIFANLGVNPRGPEGFSGYRWMKEALRRDGIPANEIAYIGDYKSALERQKLFNDMNEGKVRILIGSTQKMGTGVNVQRRLIAVHNQDPLWFPADDEQRNGRLLRQGNHNPEVQIHDYTTKGTYDSQMWKLMAKKAGFIEQFFRGDPNLRDMEDIGEASMYEQASAMSTTDERILTLTQWKEDLRREEMRKFGHEEEQWALRQKHKSKLNSAEWYEKRAANLEKDIAQRKDTSGKNFSITIAGETFTERAKAKEAFPKAVQKRFDEMGEGGASVIANIGGFPIRLMKPRKNYMLLSLGQNGSNNTDLSRDNTVASAEAVIRGFESDRIRVLKEAANDREDAKAIEPYLDKPFTGGPEIERLTGLINELEAVLKAEASGKKKPGESPLNEPPEELVPD